MPGNAVQFHYAARSDVGLVRSNNQDSGVWGGMSEEDRRSLKRRAARARRAGC